MDKTLTNAAIKLLGYTAILTLSQLAEPRLFLTLAPILCIAGVLTLVGLFGDVYILPRLHNIPALALGALGMIAIIWFVANLFPQPHVTLLSAIELAIPLGAFEFLVHRYLFRAPTT